MYFTSNETMKLCLSFLPYKISFRKDCITKGKNLCRQYCILHLHGFNRKHVLSCIIIII